MATETRIQTDGQTPIDGRARAGAVPPPPSTEPPLGELFKQLAQDSSTLIRQEMALARSEMQESISSLTRGAVMVAAGGAVLLLGLLALTAFLIIALGSALENYWLGALIVGAVYALIGAVLLMQGKNRIGGDELKPEQTIQSLKEDKRWAQSEVQQVKRDLTS